MNDIFLGRLLDAEEDEFHDFKAEWYSPHKKNEMIKDIFSFVNTEHQKDCYLIIGVDDEHSVVGVNHDENRRNTQQLTDFLSELPIANSSIPKIKVDTIKSDGYIIDIIVIKNTFDVPLYLSKDKRFPNSQGYIRAGQIFVRENDINTSINKTAKDYQVERLWKKRFRLNLSIENQYMYKLNDINNWEFFENSDGQYYLYKPNPDYCIYLEDDPIANTEFESYSLSQIRKKIFWNNLIFKFRNVIVYEGKAIYLDGSRFLAIPPRSYFLEHFPNFKDCLTYSYILKDSLNYSFQKMVFNNPNVYKPDSSQKTSFTENIVLFDNKVEMKKVNNKLNIEKIKKECHIDSEYVKTECAILNDEFKNVQYDLVFGMIKENRISRYINSYFMPISQRI